MSRITRRQFLHVSATAAAGALLAACGKKKETVAPTAVQPAATQPVEVKATSTPEGPKRPTTFPLGDVPRNRTLIYSYGGAGAADICSPLPSAYNHQVGLAVLWEPFAFYAAHAGKYYNWLAESFEYNADATVCTVHLRKGIEWSDGTPATANDAVWSMSMLQTNPGVNRAGVYVQELDKAEALDDYTLKISLKQPDYRLFIKSLTFRFDNGDDTTFLPAHIFKDIPVDELKSFKFYDAAKQWPVTTGPYGVVEASDQNRKFDLRPSWWAVKTGLVPKEPEVWRFIWLPYNNDTLGVQQLINNEVDVTLDMRPLITASLLAQCDHVTTWTGKKPPFGYMDWWPISVQFCTMKPPFDNPKVRWAVAYALNQQAVVDTAWAGAGAPSEVPFPKFANLMKYIDSIKDIIAQYNPMEFNLDKSAQLMQEAGFTKDKDNYWVDKDGKRPDSDLYAAVPLFADLGPVVAEQLRTAGFACEHKAPQDVWAAKVDGRASMFLFGHGGGVMDPYDTFQLYRKAAALGTPMGQQNWSNLTRWYNDEFEALTEELNKTPVDDPKAFDIFHKAMEIWYKELPDCPLVQWFHRIPVNTFYWDNWPDEQNPYMNSAPWHLTGLVVVIGLKAKQTT